MTRLFLAIPCSLFLASLGAFFLFVPPLLIVIFALLLAGIMLIFSLGLHLELQPVAPSSDIDRKA